jgi:hypothetical protein
LKMPQGIVTQQKGRSSLLESGFFVELRYRKAIFKSSKAPAQRQG